MQFGLQIVRKCQIIFVIKEPFGNSKTVLNSHELKGFLVHVFKELIAQIVLFEHSYTGIINWRSGIR